MWSSDYPNSLGLFYSAITDFLGFAVNEGEYKVMGLAAYGEPIFYQSLSKTIYFKDGKLHLDDNYYDFYMGLTNGLGEKILNQLNNNPKEPWFFLIHSMDLHPPVNIDKKFEEKVKFHE